MNVELDNLQWISAEAAAPIIERHVSQTRRDAHKGKLGPIKLTENGQMRISTRELAARLGVGPVRRYWLQRLEKTRAELAAIESELSRISEG